MRKVIQVLIVGAAAAVLMSMTAVHGAPTAKRRSKLELTAAQKARLNRALEKLHGQYDAKERMLGQPFSSPGYHTTLSGGMVHSTRSSLTYAVALLDTGDEALRQRAEDILRRVIALQDQDPSSKTYGIWSWFLEEPLAKMSPPDWNWADFCGTALLQVALDHRERLPTDLQEQLDTAIRHAARSIQQRNVGPGYTNIAIMGTYVTLVAAELYGIPDLRDYALGRLRRFHEYTEEQGAFTEYNSPTYTVVALKELARLRLDVQEAEARAQVETLYRRAWEEIALHFHAPTRQWAGPHSRSYSTLLRPDVLALIDQATEGRAGFKVDQSSIDEHRLPMSCPVDMEHVFTGLKAERELKQFFLRGSNPVIGTTYLDPLLTVASVNRGDLWNQRRALVAYWGTAKEPAYLHVRMMRDNYDFAAAQFFSVQKKGDVLAGINFATDGGLRHVSLDRMKESRFVCRDLRLRFELGGAAGKEALVAPTALSKPVQATWGPVKLAVSVTAARFPDSTLRWESGQKDQIAWFDMVLYSGPEKVVNLADISEAVLIFAVRLAANSSPPPEVDTQWSDGRVKGQWNRLRLDLPVRPAKTSMLQSSFRTETAPEK